MVARPCCLMTDVPPRPHPLMLHVVSNGALLLGVASLCSVVSGANEGLMLVVRMMMCLLTRAQFLLMVRRMF